MDGGLGGLAAYSDYAPRGTGITVLGNVPRTAAAETQVISLAALFFSLRNPVAGNAA